MAKMTPCGSIGALASAFGGYHLRHRVVHYLHVPDPVQAPGA